MQTADLFDFATTEPSPQDRNKSLCQYFTPEWVAEELYEQFVAPRTTAADIFCEPSCGRGACLKAIPSHIQAFGVEIDPALAETARQTSNREVICGDFQLASLPARPTRLFGNPPFDASIFDGFLHRAEDLLPKNGECAFILPAYFFQTSSRVSRYNQAWSIVQNLLPREIFPGLSVPLVFATFTKDYQKTLVGFALYKECNEIKAVSKKFLHLLVGGTSPVPPWKALVEAGLKSLGGEGSIEEIFKVLTPHCPKSNNHPRNKIRQTLQRGRDQGLYSQSQRGHWKLAA